jgi:hypothetical protein
MFGGNLSRPCTMFVLQICYQIFVICRVHAPYGGKSYSSYTYLVLASFLILSVCREPMAAIEKRVTEALAEYEARHEFARLVTLPVEDRVKYMPRAKWEGGYRWFRADNVICLEKIRQLKSQDRR